MRHVTLALLLVAGPAFAIGCGQQTGSSKQAVAPKSVDKLNSLLRGELSAVETYKQALAKEGAEVSALSMLLAEHQEAVAVLSARARALGGTPATESGAWGGFAKAIEGTAKVLGNDAAMKALQLGEEQGTRSYESALEGSDLDAESMRVIRETILPRQREHGAALQRLIDAPPPPPPSPIAAEEMR
jgi:hypothetical protein